jgi:hypothetical protein
MGEQAAQEGANLLLDLAAREQGAYDAAMGVQWSHAAVDYSWAKRNEAVASLLMAFSIFILMGTIVLPIWLFTR